MAREVEEADVRAGAVEGGGGGEFGFEVRGGGGVEGGGGGGGEEGGEVDDWEGICGLGLGIHGICTVLPTRWGKVEREISVGVLYSRCILIELEIGS